MLRFAGFMPVLSVSCFLGYALLVQAYPVGADRLVFSYAVGDEYRILSEIEQDVYVNGDFNHSAYTLSRIAVKIPKVENGRGWHEVQYQTSEEARIQGGVKKLDQTYEAQFWRDNKGVMDIAPGFFVPTVRNVPVFPDKDLSPGVTWTYPGSEVQDLRIQGVADPLTYPMDVKYRFEGPDSKDGKKMLRLSAFYNIAHKFPPINARLAPVGITGTSQQTIWWDPVAGRLDSAEDNYLLVLTYSNGMVMQFQGVAHSRVVDAKPLDTQGLKKDIESTVQELNLKDVKVRQDEEGVTISLENIQFAPDSADLLPSELPKLEALTNILKKYPDRDILVSGHTALAGTPEARKKLSEERAAAVGQYLLKHGVQRPDQVMFQGFGAEKPVADNTSEEGRMRNRRVEITILKN